MIAPHYSCDETTARVWARKWMQHAKLTSFACDVGVTFLHNVKCKLYLCIICMCKKCNFTLTEKVRAKCEHDTWQHSYFNWPENEMLILLFLFVCLFLFDYTAENHWTFRKLQTKNQRPKNKCLSRCHILKVASRWCETVSYLFNIRPKNMTRIQKNSKEWWFNTRWGCCQRKAMMWALTISVAFSSDVTQRHKVQMCRRRLTQVVRYSTIHDKRNSLLLLPRQSVDNGDEH